MSSLRIIKKLADQAADPIGGINHPMTGLEFDVIRRQLAGSDRDKATDEANPTSPSLDILSKLFSPAAQAATPAPDDPTQAQPQSQTASPDASDPASPRLKRISNLLKGKK